jgi:hypothetical protein
MPWIPNIRRLNNGIIYNYRSASCCQQWHRRADACDGVGSFLYNLVGILVMCRK